LVVSSKGGFVDWKEMGQRRWRMEVDGYEESKKNEGMMDRLYFPHKMR